jgi:hypothetical protein
VRRLVSTVDLWAVYGQRVALDRYAAGRHVDRQFVADVDAYVTAVVEQTGRDREAAVFAVHMGLYSAHLLAATGGGRVGYVERLSCDDQDYDDTLESA